MRRLPEMLRFAGWLIGLAVVYVGLGMLSFRLSQINDAVTENLFLPEGLALGVALLAGRRVWPAVLVGHFLLGRLQHVPVDVALLTSLANVGELLLGVSVLERLRFNVALSTARDYVVLVVTSALLLQPFSRVAGAALLALFGVFRADLNILLGAVRYWSLGQAICQILVTGTLLAVADAVRRGRSRRYWAALFASMGALAWLFTLLGSAMVSKDLHFVHIVSLVYLLMMAVAIGFDLVGAMIGNLLLLGVTQHVLHMDGSPLAEDAAGVAQLRYLNIFLVGVLLNAGLIGALLKERGDRQARLEELAHRDYLTGLYNRRFFFETAGRELARMRRHALSLGLICVDIDWFKRINDAHGHETGDRVLVFFAGVLQRHLRSEDLAARMGGEEFAILVDGTSDVLHVAARLRSSLEVALSHAPDIPPFTVSMGTTRLRSGDAGIGEAFRRADAALYEAKRSGRNIVVADEARAQPT